VRAALGQFEACYKMSCPANLVVFRFLNDEQRAYDIIEKVRRRAAGAGAGEGGRRRLVGCGQRPRASAHLAPQAEGAT
jgi:hypothetical protein